MRKNVIPAVIAFAPGLLLPLIQDVVRPRFPHTRAWTPLTAAKLFAVWSAFTVVALLLDEYLSPFGPNAFDPADIAAGVGGVAIAAVVFYTLLQERLTFGEEAMPARPPADQPAGRRRARS